VPSVALADLTNAVFMMCDLVLVNNRNSPGNHTGQPGALLSHND
jgi:hypothetical protein